MAHTIIVLDTDGATPLFAHITGPTEAEASKKARKALRKHGMTVRNFTQLDVTAYMTQLSPDDTTEQWIKQSSVDTDLPARAAEYEAEATKIEAARLSNPAIGNTSHERVSIYPTYDRSDPYEGHLG